MARVAAVKAVLAWVNSHPTLTGPGNPLDQGAFRTQVRSPSRGAYLVLARIDSTDALTAEEGVDQARIAGVVYAGTDEAAEDAAVAYANALCQLTGTPAVMGDAICLVGGDIVGPQFIDDRAGSSGELFAYQVDCDLFMINGGA
jgi:hypothetical protein